MKTANGVRHVNGGIGEDSQKAMMRDAENWPLRMTFSQSGSGNYVADVKLEVQNGQGVDVFALDNAGPITYVWLKPGVYKISVDGEGAVRTRWPGVDVDFHRKH